MEASPEFGCGSNSCLPCVVPNALPYCTQEGECRIAACNGDWEDCDGDPLNGCETDLASDRENCGSCGSRCELENAYASCSEGNCAIVGCDTGFLDANQHAADGCEAAP